MTTQHLWSWYLAQLHPPTFVEFNNLSAKPSTLSFRYRPTYVNCCWGRPTCTTLVWDVFGWMKDAYITDGIFRWRNQKHYESNIHFLADWPLWIYCDSSPISIYIAILQAEWQGKAAIELYDSLIGLSLDIRIDQFSDLTMVGLTYHTDNALGW